MHPRCLLLGFALFLVPLSVLGQEAPLKTWSQVDRQWAGPDYWANRLQDWRLVDGNLVCVNDALPMRTVHILTRRLGPQAGTMHMDVTVQMPASEALADDASAGFMIGAGASDLDYRAAALTHHRTGAEGGLYAGLDRNGTLFIRSHQAHEPRDLQRGVPIDIAGAVTLSLDLRADHTLILRALRPADQAELGRIETTLPDPSLSGSLALVAHRVEAVFGPWQMDGDRLETYDDRHLGPIVSAQHTLSENILTMSAQFMPIGEHDNRIARLQVQHEGQWIDIASDDVASPAYVAVFRVHDWDALRDQPYRVAYDLIQRDGTEHTYTWAGTIRRDPVDQDVVTIAGFTGNHNTKRGFEGAAPYTFDAHHLWFPHNDIVDHVRKQRPDVLFFSGDQVYEGASPTRPDREHIMLDYLYKWYLYCWAYRDLTKDIPTITIPDDHDVFQGNIWGEGGRKTDKDNKGGYVYDADFVRMVEKTQTGNLPPPFDPRPIGQGIGVYFTNLKVGRIGLAVIEDRKFKSGPNGRIVGAASGRADHINNPDYDIRRADIPGVTLLGERQLAFLDAWTQDWKGEDMKAVLSQTVFANMATHHGADLFRLIADLDSNGWPQTGRAKALTAIRRGFAMMLAGDQHLSTVVHHGIEAHNDAGFSFAVPSVANFYPRAWSPEAEGRNRPPGAPPILGEHRDGLQNYVTVHAVYNPPGFTGISTGVEPLALHDRAPGYGIVRFNKATRVITMENWPRYVDPAASEAPQYEGWPVTIDQTDNYGRAAAAYLPTIEVSGLDDPVVQLVNEDSGEVVYTLRINGQTFRPKVFAAGATYTVKVGDPDTDRLQVFEHVRPLADDESESLRVSF